MLSFWIEIINLKLEVICDRIWLLEENILCISFELREVYL